MSTVYLVTTNGIQHLKTHTSKATALKAAEAMRESAEGMTGRNIITVTTEKTGKEVYRWESAEMVEITGEYVEAEDVHAHMAEQTAWMTQEGVCMGLCAVGTGCGHCDEQYGEIEPQTDAESVYDPTTAYMVETVCVIQNIPGSNGNMHYHTPGCRDIVREAKRHGQSENDVFTGGFLSAADILSHEYADVCNGDAEGIVAEANSEYFGVRVMPCLDIPFGELSGIPLAIRNGEFILAPTEVREEGCEHGAINGPCCDIENDVPMVEMEFYLSVEVETGVTVDLGWHTFNGGVPATWDNALIADLYGTRHGSGNPKGGWSSIIRVIDFAAL